MLVLVRMRIRINPSLILLRHIKHGLSSRRLLNYSAGAGVGIIFVFRDDMRLESIVMLLYEKKE